MMRTATTSARVGCSMICAIRPGFTVVPLAVTGSRIAMSPHRPAVTAAPSRPARVRPAAGHRAVVLCAAEAEDLVQVEIKVEGMVCGGCSSRVIDALKGVDRVRTVDVSLETKLARVDVAAGSQIDALVILEKLVDAVNDLGFAAEPHFG